MYRESATYFIRVFTIPRKQNIDAREEMLACLEEPTVHCPEDDQKACQMGDVRRSTVSRVAEVGLTAIHAIVQYIDRRARRDRVFHHQCACHCFLITSTTLVPVSFTSLQLTRQ